MSIPRLFSPLVFATLSFAASIALAQTSNETIAKPASQEAVADKSAAIDAQSDEKTKLAELEHSLRDMLELNDVQNIVYKDEHGTALTSDEFYKRVNGGGAFSTAKIMTGNRVTSATLTLQTAEEAKTQATNTYKINPGDAFPAFRKKDLTGHGISNKQLLGRYSLINFYFAHCAPCVKEIPDLNALAGNHTDMNFIAITFDSNAETRAFVSERKFNWKILADDKAFISKLGVRAYPAFMVLDPKGKVIAIATGSEIGNSDGSVEKWISRVMKPAG